MHRLFGPVLAPLIEALEPRRAIETGAGSGRLTEKLLDAPGAQRLVLHAIDPEPRLDPGLLARCGERLEVHPERAVGAIGAIGAVDLALLDGDPNWYSVHSELTLLLRAAEREERPAPLLVIHHVHWPFGRRDGYYDPAAIPPAHLREHSELGLLPGERDPAEGGLQLTPWCARRDFEPRSGVLSAVEDAVAASALEWTVLEVPGFHGAAVLVEARRLAERPALAAVLDELRSARFLGEQARRAESARLAAEAGVGEPNLSEPSPAPQPALESPPEPPQPGLVAELESDLAEQRARRSALEWQLERLDADLRAQGERLDVQAAERDGERRAAIEAGVRLEDASAALSSERQAATALRERVAALEKEAELRARELGEATERERLAEGRLAHREEALQAARAERERLAAESARLDAALHAAQAQLQEVAALLHEAGQSRWARFRRWLGRVARAATFRGPAAPDALESARASAERALPAAIAAPEPGDPRTAGAEPEREHAG